MAGSSTTSGGSQSNSFLMSILQDPAIAQLFANAQASIPTNLMSVQDMIQNGVNSPLLATAVNAALQRLKQPQMLDQQRLTDAFRSAGGLRGSQYGVRFNELLGQQGVERNDLMSATMKQILAPLLDAQLREQVNSFLPARTMTDLLQASRPAVGQQSSSFSSGSSAASGDSFGGDTNDWLRRIGYQPTSGGGGGQSGVNAPTNQPGTGGLTNYDPYGGYGFGPSYGEPGAGYGGPPNGGYPEYGPWVDMPSSSPSQTSPYYPTYDDPGTYLEPVTPQSNPGDEWAGWY